jgi:hypothetical protein
MKALLLAAVVFFGLCFTALSAASMYGGYYTPTGTEVAGVIFYGLFLTAGLGAILYYLTSK